MRDAERERLGKPLVANAELGRDERTQNGLSQYLRDLAALAPPTAFCG